MYVCMYVCMYITRIYTRFLWIPTGRRKKRGFLLKKHTRLYAQATRLDPAKNDAVLHRNEARIDVFRFLGSVERAGALRVRWVPTHGKCASWCRKLGIFV